MIQSIPLLNVISYAIIPGIVNHMVKLIFFRFVYKGFRIIRIFSNLFGCLSQYAIQFMRLYSNTFGSI